MSRATDHTILLRARPRLHYFALRLGRRHRDLLSRDELRSIADGAMLDAWQRYRPGRCAFTTFARHWVYGAVLREVARELAERARRAEFELVAPPLIDCGPHPGAMVRQLVERLPRRERGVLISHALGGEPLASIARAAGRHRSWASRVYQRALSGVRRGEPRGATASPVTGSRYRVG